MKASITRSKGTKKLFLSATAAVFWIAVWYIAAFGIGNEIFLPYPHTTLLAFCRLVVTGDFWSAVLQSMLTILEGCLIGCAIGILLSVPAALFRLAGAIFSPLITVLRATPVASFIILIYVIVRRMRLPVRSVSLLIVILMVIPILYSNLLTGYQSLDKSLGEVAAVYRFSFPKKLFVLWFPQIRPFFFSGVTTALGFAWKSGVAAEVICNLENTIGKNLSDAKSNLEMDKLFAWTFTVVLLSLLFELFFKRLVRPRSVRSKDRADRKEGAVRQEGTA